MVISRDAFLSANTATGHKDVEIPGGTARIKQLSGLERDQFEQVCHDSNKSGLKVIGVRARLVALCLVDENGDRLFSDNDIGFINEKVSSSVLDKLFDAASDLNRLSDKDIDDLEKN